MNIKKFRKKIHWWHTTHASCTNTWFIFFSSKISNKICSDQQSQLFLLRDIRAITNDNEISSVFISTGRKTTTFAPRSPSFSELLETARYYWFLYITPPHNRTVHVCAWARVDIRFSSPYTRARVCVFTQRIEGFSCVSFTHRSSLDARAQERRDESFRFPFSNSTRLSTGYQVNGKLLYGASAWCSFWLKIIVHAFSFVR